ncbi:MAG: exonuclease, RdgC family protein [Burkholderiaceae bacterium]|nr:exonuclease, RdgC family protein [Burkholderiaceae bacterium]
MNLIKNALIYKIDLPNADALRKHFSEKQFTEIGACDYCAYGFVPCQEGDLVSVFNGGIAFSVRYDQKILPASVINTEVNERVKRIEEAEGIRVGRKWRREIKEMAIPELLAKSHVATKIITSFYHRETRTLIVPVSSKKLAGVIAGLLVQAVGAAKTETINVSDVKGGLTTRLRTYLTAEDDSAMTAFGSFALNPDVWLKGEGGKVTYQIASIDNGSEGIVNAIAAGLKVDAVRLGFVGVSFKLTSDFALKGVRFSDTEPQEHQTSVDEWMHEASVQTLQVVSAVEELCRLFDYQVAA